MNVQDYLKQVAVIGSSDIAGDDGEIYYTKFNGDYITRVGLEENVKFLADREITEELTHGVGFSPKENKWYGWSHRGICGFSIGSECKKGHVHYRASSLEDEIEDAIRFWSDEYHVRTWCETVMEDCEEPYIEILWEYSDQVPNEKLRGTIGGIKHYFNPNDLGKGEWIAETMEDAKQMAIDFNRNIS